MDEGLDDATRYVTLHAADGTQLARANGYAPKAVAPADLDIANDGTVTLPAQLAIYTATSANAVQAHQVGLAENADGTGPLLSPQDIADTVANPKPPAPGNGETLRLSITIAP